MKRLYILFFTVGLVSLCSCKKFLEQAPDQRTTVNSVEKVAELLTSAYPESNYIAFMEAASDNAEDRGFGIGEDNPTYSQPFYWKDNPQDTQDTPSNYWYACYEAIAAANQALVAIQNSPNQTNYLPYKGEALLARAYAHFMLVTLFSKTYDPAGTNDSPGIPYVTTPEKVVVGQYQRGTVASVYDQIDKDIQEGLPLIKNTAYKIVKFHFNTAAANAFAARFYLFKKDYAKVITYASAVASGGSFTNIIRPWSARYHNFTGAEMYTNFTNITEPSNLLIIETQSLWGRAMAYGPAYMPRFGFGVVMSQSMFYTPNVTGQRWDENIYNWSAPNYSFYKFTEYFAKTNVNSTIGNPYTMVPVLTTDEALLNRAEAYAANGQNDLALNDLNTFCSTRIQNYNPTANAVTLDKISAFYGTTDPKAGLIATVLSFKKSEFVQEGLRWLDVLRYHIPVTHKVLKTGNLLDYTIQLSADDPRRLFQIPSQTSLSGLQQNPR